MSSEIKTFTTEKDQNLTGQMQTMTASPRTEEEEETREAEGLNTPQGKGIHQQCW